MSLTRMMAVALIVEISDTTSIHDNKHNFHHQVWSVEQHGRVSKCFPQYNADVYVNVLTRKLL